MVSGPLDTPNLLSSAPRADPGHRPRRRLLVVAVSIVALLAVGALGYLVLTAAFASDDLAVEVTTPTSSADAATEPDTDAEGLATGPTDVDDTVAGPMPFLSGRLDMTGDPAQGVVAVSGRVPPGIHLDELTAAVDVAFGPLAVVDIETDPSLTTERWMAAASSLIPLLATLAEGSVMVDGTGIRVEGVAVDPEAAATYENTIAGLRGKLRLTLPADTSDLEVVDRASPRLQVVVADGTMMLAGEVPDERIAQMLANAAATAHGPDGIDNQLAVNPETHLAFWMFTMPTVFSLFEAFASYHLSIDDTGVSGDLQADAGFAPGSAELSESALRIVPIGMSIMTRDPRMTMTVAGYTDSSGSTESNNALSWSRAQAVAAAFINAGIDPGRLTVVGKGETEPIATNETPEGRAANRRVEFTFGSEGALATP